MLEPPAIDRDKNKSSSLYFNHSQTVMSVIHTLFAKSIWSLNTFPVFLCCTASSLSLLCRSNSDAALLTGSGPSQPNIPPALCVSPSQPPHPPPFFPLYIRITSVKTFFRAAHVLTMCSSSPFPILSLLPLSCLIHFLSSILPYSLLQNDSHPPSHPHMHLFPLLEVLRFFFPQANWTR